MNRTIAGPTGPITPSSFNDRAGITSVVLPSMGIPYKKADGSLLYPGGAISISAMTVAEEKLMSTKASDSSRKICNLMERVVDLRGMRADQLLLADQFFLLLKIRALSYGSVYSFQFRCESCQHQWKHDLNLETDLRLSVADDDWVEPFEVTLPVSGKMIQYRLLRSIDEINLNTKRIKKGNELEDSTFVALLASGIVSIDGEPVTNSKIVEGWLEKQVVRDRATFSASIKSNTPGYSGEIDITCPSCGYSHEAVLPMTADFFRSDVSA